MDLTFRVKNRGNSLNFLEKFKDKISRVDKYSGIMGILAAQPHKSRFCDTEQYQSETLQSRAVSNCSLRREKINRQRVVTQPSQTEENLNLHNLIKEIKKESNQNQLGKLMKNGELQVKRQTATIMLPPIKMSRNEKEVCLNRLKKVKRQKAKLNWLVSESNKESKGQVTKIRELR